MYIIYKYKIIYNQFCTYNFFNPIRISDEIIPTPKFNFKNLLVLVEYLNK